MANNRVSFDDPTLSDLLDRWLEHITGLGRSATTLYHYRQYVDREIVPVLGGIRLSKLSTLEIDALYTKLRKRGATWPSWHPLRHNPSASNIRLRSPLSGH